MPVTDLYKSNVRSSGDLAGVAEYDGDTGCFYLYDNRPEVEGRIIGYVQFCGKLPEARSRSLTIRWDYSDRFVGVFVDDHLYVYFDAERRIPFTREMIAKGNGDAELPIWRA